MAGGLGSAYGQTDVMHDRSYLISQMANRSRAVRQQAAAALDNLDRQQALQQRDQALQQHQMAQEATQRRITAHQNAMEMDKQLKIDRDTEIDEQGHGAMLSMMQLEAAKRRGDITKAQFDDGLLNVAAQFPLASRHPEASKHLEFLSHEADKQNTFLDRLKAREDAKSTARMSGPVPEKIAQRYAKLQGDIVNYEGLRKADYARQAKANAGTENVPYNPTFDDAAAKISAPLAASYRDAEILQNAYPQLNQLSQGRQIQQIQSEVNTPSPQPSPEPSPTPDTRPVQGFDIPILANTAPQPSSTPISTPSPSPEATATTEPLPTQTPVHLGKYNPETGEFE